MQYLFKLPKKIPTGKVLVHNNVRPTRRLGSRGFRAWLASPDDTRLEICGCGWAPELGRHFIVRKVGRKPASGVKSSIKAQPAQPFTDKRAQLLHDSREWRMVLLRACIGDGSKLPDNYLSARAEANRAALAAMTPGKRYLLLHKIDSLWRDVRAQFERAVLDGNADWFRRQADAVERKSEDTPRGRFEANVVTLVLQAAILNAKGNGVTASDIYDVLDKKDSQTDKQLHGVLVEGLQRENRNRCIQEIHELARLIGLPLPDIRGKHSKTKSARIAPTLDLRNAIERLRQAAFAEMQSAV